MFAFFAESPYPTPPLLSFDSSCSLFSLSLYALFRLPLPLLVVVLLLLFLLSPLLFHSIYSVYFFCSALVLLPFPVPPAITVFRDDGRLVVIVIDHLLHTRTHTPVRRNHVYPLRPISCYPMDSMEYTPTHDITIPPPIYISHTHATKGCIRCSRFLNLFLLHLITLKLKLKHSRPRLIIFTPSHSNRNLSSNSTFLTLDLSLFLIFAFFPYVFWRFIFIHILPLFCSLTTLRHLQSWYNFSLSLSVSSIVVLTCAFFVPSVYISYPTSSPFYLFFFL